MNESGSLCPAVKAADIIGDKWVLLILREVFLGSTRYNDFQRALPRISPTVLSKRLKQLEANGLLVKKQSPGQKSTEYRLTPSGRELGPIVDHMATWGLRWARRQIKEEDYDVSSFMWDFHRTLNTSELPDGETVICVRFPDLEVWDSWWLIVSADLVDLCTDNPGKEIDLYITGTLGDLVSVWMGDVEIRAAIKSDKIRLNGESYITNSASRWFPQSPYADVRPEHLVDAQGKVRS
ncbi:MAG: HxlR family transcriptional regulator [SAR86 cluster bacterium]|uniref:HxlR family transcriptional regulator n=1 Tax=SAR86 cluster bacterium TaxID=2030880 RepID=A0A2A4WZ78_9GAMM|nr:MAG: HxlR family transcriptional regulator [SAR86 cluster bacterium]